MTYPGQCVYFKTLALRTLDYTSISQAWQKLQELSVMPDFLGGFILFEGVPLGKINSVPREATAFRRTNTTNILISAMWKDHKPGNEMMARRYAHDVADILLRGQAAMTTSESLGYANHGTLLLLKLLLCMMMTLSRQTPLLLWVTKIP